MMHISSAASLLVALGMLGLCVPELRAAPTSPVDYINPQTGGGSLLDKDSGGLGEPLNVIISGLSSPQVLSDDGFVHFANAIGFAKECLGIHLGAPQTANLGDGNGWTNQIIELREDSGNSATGACSETVKGGNHLRMWRQNGPTANTSALFLAVSEEESLIHRHTIAKDGYNTGRENFVKGAVGSHQYKGVKYQIVMQNITGMVPSGSTDINHGISIDGVIALLNVTIVS